MSRTVDVLIIGTEPPCPRCDLLDVFVAKVTPPDVQVNVEHCAFDSPSAQRLGERLGCKVGTAKHVARDADIPMDWNAVYGVIDAKKSSFRPDARPADTWTPELDELLRPCEEVAEPMGYLMTPVLVINGKVVHHGSVPSQEKVASWLSE